MRTSYLLSVFLLLFCLGNECLSQSSDYQIGLVNETFLPEEYGEENLKGIQKKGEHLLVQFFTIPAPEQRKVLAEAGVHLGDYIPSYAYITTFEKEVDLSIFSNMNLRAIMPLDARFKLSPELFQKKYPAHCLQGENIRLQVYYFENVQFEKLAAAILPLGQIQRHHHELHLVEVELPLSNIDALMCLEEVKVLESILPEPELENTIKNTSGRTNWLNTGINGLQYDGAGATVGVEEGSRFNPAREPELRGRLNDVSTSATIGGHKTNVASDHMASAGNLIPTSRSIATGADVLVMNGHSRYQSSFTSVSLVSVNHSYGYGIGTSAWGTGATWDGWIRDSISPTHTWSAGNQSNTASNYGPYGGISGFANLTGGIKQAKNTFAVGALVPDDVLAGFSSKGPTYDGRLKPELVVEGAGGTSYAAPKITGTLGVMTNVYKGENGGVRPHISLLKAILMNTCDDLENPGPDFRTGFGRVNARRAFKTIQENRHLKGVMNNGGNSNHSIVVPANVKELRVLIHWPDYRAASSLPVKALVNDLDLTVTDPGTGVTLPWILNSAAHLDSLSKFAVRGVDNLNNMEQVTIINPAAGTYTANIAGTLIPQGPQDYYLTYEFLFDELTLAYPIGKEHFVPGETERIKWDSYGGTGTFDLEYSTDNGTSYTPIASGISSSTRNYAWSVPAHTSGEVIVRIKRGSLSSQSIEPFNIMNLATNLQVIWACGSNVMLKWDAHPTATHYRVTRLGAKYMDSIGVTSNTYFLTTGNSTTVDEYYSVQAYGADGALSRRVIAIKKTPGDINCTGSDVSVISSNTSAAYIPSCLAGSQFSIKATILNAGTNTVSNTPVSYQLNGGTVYSDTIAGSITSPDDTLFAFKQMASLIAGTNTLKVWTALAGDGDGSNDTLVVSFSVYPSVSKTLPYTQSFDNWTSCSTAWGCSGVSCTAEEDWLNIPNVPALSGDSIDWRTDAGGTASSSTGPSQDHTSGSGNYLYLEGSGNNGSGCQLKTAILNSPCFDLRPYDTVNVSFWYHMYGSSIGELHLDLLTESGLVMDVMTPKTGAQGNQWIQAQVDISAYVGQTVALRFRGSTGSGYTADLAIDDIQVTGAIDSCAAGYCGLSATVLLEGPYDQNTSVMSNVLQQSNLIPLTEPYTNTGYTFVQGGGDSTTSAVLQQYQITDWVVVEVRDTANPADIVYSRAALLRTNGLVVDVDGFSPVALTAITPDAYYIAIYHRNHLSIMPEAAVQISPGSPASFDLSNPATATFGTTNGRAIVQGKALMFAADADGNGQIQNTDEVLYWRPQAGLAGYYSGDFDLNGQVQNSERVFFWIKNVGRGSGVPQ